MFAALFQGADSLGLSFAKEKQAAPFDWAALCTGEIGRSGDSAEEDEEVEERAQKALFLLFGHDEGTSRKEFGESLALSRFERRGQEQVAANFRAALFAGYGLGCGLGGGMGFSSGAGDAKAHEQEIEAFAQRSEDIHGSFPFQPVRVE